MQVLSSLSSIPFYAPSAGFAPTNSADVSAIASAYAESAASSKLDSTASSSFYPSDNPSGFISGVDLSDYATTAYVDSSLSGKLDTTAQVVTSIGVAAGALSSINGYGLSAGLANSAGTATVWLGASSKLDASAASDFALTAQLEDYLEKTASSQFLTSVPDGYATTEYVDSSISGFAYESAVSGWTAKQDKLTFGYNTADQISSIDGSALGGMDEAAVSAIASAYAESAASSKQDTLTFGYNAEDKISSINGSSLAGEGGGGGLVTAIGTSESGITSINNSGLVDTAALRSADYSSLYVQEPLYISASGDSSYIGISGDVGGVDSATCSAIASAYAESAASSKLDSSASSSFYGIDNPSGFLTTAYTPTFGYNTADQISSIDGSALGGMDEAAVSGIASAYAESAVSSVSGNYYTTANESGFLTAQAQASWSESASASPSYIQDKPDLVDIVAGPGIVVDNPDGNTLRVSMAQDYEVTLWSGTGTSGSTINLSETVKNFDRVRFYGHESNRGRGCLYEINPNISYDANTLQFAIATTDAAYAGAAWFIGQYLTYLTYTDTAATSMTVNGGEQWFSFSNTSGIQHNTARYVILDKIVGINRTASAQ